MTPSPPAPSSATPWPAVGSERAIWHFSDEVTATLDPYVATRLEGLPYEAAVVPAIASRDPRAALSADAIEDCADALAAVAMFERESAALPVPMPAILLRTESASSSQIENLTANARNLAQATLGIHVGENAALVAANVAAMTRALGTQGALSVSSILAMHAALMERSMPRDAGRLRDQQVWIGRRAISPHDAEFVPPVWGRVRDGLADLCAFAASRDGNPLARAAIAHAQFETIHPFVDGNGRTGRALVHVILRDSGVVQRSTVPVSAGLLGNVRRYFDALTAYRSGDVEPIVREFAGAAVDSVANGRRLTADIAGIRDAWRSRIAARSDSGAWRLSDALFEQPVINGDYVQRALSLSTRGALNAIGKLVDAGVLTQSGSDRRNRVWQATAVLDATDAFAARARRGRAG